MMDAASRGLMLDAGRKTTARFDAPLGDLMDRTRGTPCIFQVGSIFAVLQTIRPLNSSMLFLYDAEQKSAYQEILGDMCLPLRQCQKKRRPITDRLFGSMLEYSLIMDGVAAAARTRSWVDATLKSKSHCTDFKPTIVLSAEAGGTLPRLGFDRGQRNRYVLLKEVFFRSTD